VVIVLYFPKEENIANKMEHLNGVEIIFVDNTPNLFRTFNNRCVYISLGENKGIAYAQNKGIEEALKRGCTHVVFFDQDSDIPKDYIHNILKEHVRIKDLYPNLAVLGPKVINLSTGSEYKSAKIKIENNCKVVASLISSGTIIETAILFSVGYLEESLFIDYVDFEWCWRARSKGFLCCSTLNVSLAHKVGEKDFTFCGYPIILSAPIRYYYQYRNFIWLSKRNYVPIQWKIKGFIKKLFGCFYIPIVSKHHWMVIKNIFLGIKDGLICKSYEEKNISLCERR